MFTQDVVYSDVKLKPPRDATPSSNNEHIGTIKADDVIYSKFFIRNPDDMKSMLDKG